MVKSFLHVGPGNSNKENTTPYFNNDNWDETRLDINPNANPDIVASMLDMSIIEDNSYDAVYSAHNIEHVYAHEIRTALSEMYRVIKDDGFLFITCPDLQSVCDEVSKGNLLNPLYKLPNGEGIAAIDILYGHRPSLKAGNHYMAHKVGFTGEVLYGTIKDAGFKSAVVCFKKKQFALWCIAYKELLLSKEELTQELSNHIDISL